VQVKRKFREYNPKGLLSAIIHNGLTWAPK